jgi:hypothetical protein
MKIQLVARVVDGRTLDIGDVWRSNTADVLLGREEAALPFGKLELVPGEFVLVTIEQLGDGRTKVLPEPADSALVRQNVADESRRS